MTSSTDPAFTLNPTVPSQPTLDARPGTGLMPSAQCARPIGCSTQTASASQSVISAELPTHRDSVIHATGAMTSSMDHACSLPPTVLLSLTLAAISGTGLPMPARFALIDGYWPIPEPALKSPIFARPIPPTVSAAAAMPATTLPTVLVFILHLTPLPPLILGAANG
jgi:hypothetical protein